MNLKPVTLGWSINYLLEQECLQSTKSAKEAHEAIHKEDKQTQQSWWEHYFCTLL